MAAGLPVIAVDACGVHDIVRNGKNGYLVEENEDEFAEQVCMMMNHKEGYRKLKDGALHTADGYHMSCIAKKAEMDYRMMLERERSREYYGCQTGWKKDAESSLPFSRITVCFDCYGIVSCHRPSAMKRYPEESVCSIITEKSLPLQKGSA